MLTIDFRGVQWPYPPLMEANWQIDTKNAKSKYTADRQMPGAFEGETVTRRRFMELATHGAGGVAAVGVHAARARLRARPAVQPRAVRLAAGRSRPPTSPSHLRTTKVITIVQGIGDAGNTIAYVRKRNPAIDTEPEDQYNHYVALSSRCMHLGCPVRYVAAAERFICPCHGGVYDFRGMVVGGPPVRPLDRFYTRVAQRPGRRSGRATRSTSSCSASRRVIPASR